MRSTLFTLFLLSWHIVSYANELAHQDSVVYITNINHNNSCSGVLIRPNVVLTAAHCVATTDSQNLKVTNYKNPTMGLDGYVGVRELVIASDYSHGEYTEKEFLNDYAIMILSDDIKISNYPKLIPEDYDHIVPKKGESYFLNGYGQTSPANRIYKNLKIKGNKFCFNKEIGNMIYLAKGSVLGDSGAAVFKEIDSDYFISGIIVAEKNYLFCKRSLATRTKIFREWLNNELQLIEDQR